MARKSKRQKNPYKGYTNSELQNIGLMAVRMYYKRDRELGRKALKELHRRRSQKVRRKKGYINVMGKWVRVD